MGKNDRQKSLIEKANQASNKNKRIKKPDVKAGTSSSDEEILQYLIGNKRKPRIFSFKLILISIALTVLLCCVGAIAQFLNQSNPIEYLMKSIDNTFTINILDDKNVKIFQFSSHIEGEASVDNASPSLFEAIIALHGVLEEKVNPHSIELNNTKISEYSEIRERLNTGDSLVSTNQLYYLPENYITRDMFVTSFNSYFSGGIQLVNHKAELLKNVDLLKQLSENLPVDGDDDFLTLNNVNEKIEIDSSEVGEVTTMISNHVTKEEREAKIINNVEEDISTISARMKKYFSGVVCPIYKTMKEFSNYDCLYSYPNFILNNLSTYHKEKNDFISNIINYSTLLRSYILLSWIKRNITLTKFFTIYFNSLSYGPYIIGINSAAEKFFNIGIDYLNIKQSVFLAKLIYDNNKNFYPNDIEITYADIYDRLLKNGIINADDLPAYLAETLSYEKSKSNLHNVKYLSMLFDEGYKYYRKKSEVNINTTFDNRIQNLTSNILFSKLKQSSYKHAAIMILKKNNVIASYTMGLNKKGEPNFLPDEPYVYSFTGIKPIIYLAAISNKSDVSKVLFDRKYQNLIDTYKKRIDYFNSLTDDSSADLSRLLALTSSDLDIAPTKLRNLFAKELYNLEKSYLSSIPLEVYIDTFQKLGISTNGIGSVSNLIDGKSGFMFEDIVRTYSAFQTGDNLIRNPVFLISVDHQVYQSSNAPIAEINPYYINLLKNLFLSKLTKTKNNKEVFVIYDNDSAYAIMDDSTVGIWFGDLYQKNYQYKNASDIVQATLTQIINLLY